MTQPLPSLPSPGRTPGLFLYTHYSEGKGTSSWRPAFISAAPVQSSFWIARTGGGGGRDLLDDRWRIYQVVWSFRRSNPELLFRDGMSVCDDFHDHYPHKSLINLKSSIAGSGWGHREGFRGVERILRPRFVHQVPELTAGLGE